MFRSKCQNRLQPPVEAGAWWTNPGLGSSVDTRPGSASELGFRTVAGVLCGSRDRRMRRGKSGVPKKRPRFASLPLEAPTCLQRGPSLPIPKSKQERPHPAPGRRTQLGDPLHQNLRSGHQGTGGCDQGENKHGGGHVPFFRITPTSEYPGAGGREGRRTGASLSLGEQRIKYEWSPSSHPFPD